LVALVAFLAGFALGLALAFGLGAGFLGDSSSLTALAFLATIFLIFLLFCGFLASTLALPFDLAAGFFVSFAYCFTAGFFDFLVFSSSLRLRFY
jgi:hypothetical protein